MSVGVYNHGGKLEQALKSVKSSSLSAKNKAAIVRFHNECFSEGLSIPRVIKYLYTLKRIAELLGKDFEAASKEDIKALVARIERSDYSEWTKRDFRIALKKFYRWLGGSEIYPEEVRWLKTTMKGNSRKLPEELLTESDYIY
jgi:site-specific recombinase XerD